MNFSKQLLLLLAALIIMLPLLGNASVVMHKSNIAKIKTTSAGIAKVIAEDIELTEGFEETETAHYLLPFVYSFVSRLTTVNTKQVARLNLKHAVATANTCPKYLLINRLSI